MADTSWHKQTPAKPLFEDLLWSKPENRQTAGKLLIIGGSVHGFSAPAEAYHTAVKTGIGTIRVVLPDGLRKTVGKFLDNAFFLPSTPSGSFAKSSLAELLEHTAWADGVLLAGELGRNSETAILLEQYVQKTSQPLVIARDAVDYFTANPRSLLSRGSTTLVLSLSQLQKLVRTLKLDKAITFDMGMVQLAELLHDLTTKHGIHIIVKHVDHLFVAVNGQVSITPHTQKVWRVTIGAQATVWWLQNPSKPFEALTTSVVN